MPCRSRSDIDSKTEGLAPGRRPRSQISGHNYPRTGSVSGLFLGNLFVGLVFAWRPCTINLAKTAASRQDLVETLAGYYRTRYRISYFLVFCAMCGGCAAELSCPPSLFRMVGASCSFNSTSLPSVPLFLSKALVLLQPEASMALPCCCYACYSGSWVLRFSQRGVSLRRIR